MDSYYIFIYAGAFLDISDKSVIDVSQAPIAGSGGIAFHALGMQRLEDV